MRNDYGRAFAEYYDLINSQKDYRAEAGSVFAAIERCYRGAGKAMADVGCGTGNFTGIFREKGYEVTGYDVSPHMLAIARRKPGASKYICADFSRAHRKYDLVVSMFNVVNAVGDYYKLEAFFRAVSGGLKRDGLFIFDAWNGSAVLRTPPVRKVRVIEKDGRRIVRTVVPHNDLLAQTSDHEYRIEVFSGRKPERSAASVLHHNFFTLQEMKRALAASGFEIVLAYKGNDIDTPAGVDDFIVRFACRLERAGRKTRRGSK